MHIVSDRLKQFIARTLFETIKKGGKLVAEEHKEARLAICQGCTLLGQVEPLPGLVVEGCTACGCPSATKPFMLNYFSPTQGHMVTVECAHPDGSKWEEIDQQFKTLQTT